MRDEAKERILEESRRSHLLFMNQTWSTADPFAVGFHTLKICNRIDKAIADFRKGKSTYLAVAVHNRAGKSEIMSVTLPPHFLGEFPDKSVMAVTYSSDIKSFAKKMKLEFMGSPNGPEP